MIKKLSTILLVFLLTFSFVNASLFNFYGGNLPSIQERAKIYNQVISEEEYRGTYDQNILLEEFLTGNYSYNEEELFGAALPGATAAFETSLQTGINSSVTSMTLVANAIRGGGSISGYNCFTIDEGSAQMETVCGTVSGTAVSSMTRGISQATGTTTDSDLQFSHRRGANVKITDFPLIQILKAQANGEDTYANSLLFESINSYTSTLSFTPGSNQLITALYSDQGSNQGAATSSQVIAGISEQATQIEMASSTPFDANNPHYISSEYATSSCQTAGLYVPITKNDGKLGTDCIDLSETFNHTGDITTTGNVGIGTTSPDVDLHIQLSEGEGDPTFSSGTGLVIQSNQSAGFSARSAIIAGTTGSAFLNFGDVNDDDAGFIQWGNNTDKFTLNSDTTIDGTLTVDNCIGCGGFFEKASTTDTIVADTASETAYGGGGAITTLTGGTMGTGGALKAMMTIGNFQDTGANSGVTFYMKLGGTIVCQTSLIIPPASAEQGSIDFMLFSDASNSAQCCITNASFENIVGVNENTSTIDTTIDQDITFTVIPTQDGGDTETLTMSNVFITSLGDKN